MMNVWLEGSIQTEVPVKPVWPNDPSGKSSPRGAEYIESMSQPRPRTVGLHGGLCGVVIFCTVAAAKMRLPFGPTPPANIIRQKMGKSSAVENKPACTAIAPHLREGGVCTPPLQTL